MTSNQTTICVSKDICNELNVFEPRLTKNQKIWELLLNNNRFNWLLWDGSNINDLFEIRNNTTRILASMPHLANREFASNVTSGAHQETVIKYVSENFPESTMTMKRANDDLIWACDSNGLCLVGSGYSKIKHISQLIDA